MTDVTDLEPGDLDPYDDDTTNIDIVEQQFEIYLEEAMKVPNNDEAKINFEKTRRTELSSTTRNERRNFLHFLAYADRSLRKPLHWLMQLAMLNHPKDMGVLDTSNQTPLSAAIMSRNEVFVHACIKIFKRKGSEIRAALEIAECIEQDDDKGVDTCLHLAINANLNPELIKGIIENVSEKTFCVRDRKGCTPLHLAVDYEKCTTSQVDIVSHLLRFGPHALVVKMKKDNMGPPRSAYQHHQITRKLFERNNPAKKRIMEKKKGQDMKREEGPNSDWELLEDEKKKKASSRIPTHLRQDDHRRSEHERPSLIRQGSEIVSPTTEETSVSREPSKPGGPENLVFPDRQQGPFKSTKVAFLQSQQTGEQQQEEQKLNADKIREQLKLLYLRTTKPSVALHCLQMQDERGMEFPSRKSVFQFS